jgi:hypothetical protein
MWDSKTNENRYYPILLYMNFPVILNFLDSEVQKSWFVYYRLLPAGEEFSLNRSPIYLSIYKSAMTVVHTRYKANLNDTYIMCGFNHSHNLRRAGLSRHHVSINIGVFPLRYFQLIAIKVNGSENLVSRRMYSNPAVNFKVAWRGQAEWYTGLLYFSRKWRLEALQAVLELDLISDVYI